MIKCLGFFVEILKTSPTDPNTTQGLTSKVISAMRNFTGQIMFILSRSVQMHCCVYGVYA